MKEKTIRFIFGVIGFLLGADIFVSLYAMGLVIDEKNHTTEIRDILRKIGRQRLKRLRSLYKILHLE